MTQRSLAALIMINAVLLAAVVVAVFAPRTEAQFAGSGQYLMISGAVTGRTQQSAVYIINVTTGEVMPIMYNSANQRINWFPVRNVGEDARKQIPRR